MSLTISIDMHFQLHSTYGWTVQLNRTKTYIPLKTISTYTSPLLLCFQTQENDDEPAILTRDTENVHGLTVKDILEKEDGSVFLTVEEMSAERGGRLLFMTLKYQDPKRQNMHHTLVVELCDEACVL